MSISDPWAYSELSPSSRAASPILQNENGGFSDNKIDSEIASIVSSLSVLSNQNVNGQIGNGQKMGNMGGSNANVGKSVGQATSQIMNGNNSGSYLAPNPSQHLGSFRRSSFTTNTSGGSVNEDLNNIEAGDLSFFQKSIMNSVNNRKSPLSVGSVPIVSGNNGGSQRLNLLGHYSASINGPILFHGNSNGLNNNQAGNNGSFFERFGQTLIDGTRDLENSQNSLPIEKSSEETSASQSFQQPMIPNSGELRRNSITSDATDATATSFSSTSSGDKIAEANADHPEAFGRRNFWNISNAPVFKPGYPINHTPMNMFPYSATNVAMQNPHLFPGQMHSPNHNLYFYMENGYPMVPNNMPSYFENRSNGANKPVDNARFEDRPKRFDSKNNNKGKLQTDPYLESYPSKFTKSGHNMKSMANSSSATVNTSAPSKSDGNQERHAGKTRNNGKQSHNGNKFSQGSNGGSSNSKSSEQAFQRSPLLEEFRTNQNSKTYKIKDIVGYAFEFCKDQHGSRFIQHELAVASLSEREVVFNEIRDHILELSDDVFGNYVIQKFFEHGAKTQKDVLVDQFRGRMKTLSLQMYACRVVQRALEFIELPQKIDLVLELSESVLPMIKDQNGNHVIQKAIERIPIVELPFILNSLNGQIYHLSTHAYGCRVIQRLLEFGSSDDQTKILDELNEFIPYLIQDQYGNYVIQHILQQKDEYMAKEDVSPSIAKVKQEIIDIVSNNIVDFSKHKFASNVVEKAIIHGNESQRNTIMSKILPKDEEHAANLEDDAPMILMMRDQFANYVVQKLVNVTEGDERKLIVITIRAYLNKLNIINSLGNRHLASVEKLANLVENIEI